MRYRLLGNSGLRVSEAALGTMTFSDDWGWGAEASRIELGFPYDLYAKETMRTFVYGGLRDRILA